MGTRVGVALVLSQLFQQVAGVVVQIVGHLYFDGYQQVAVALRRVHATAADTEGLAGRRAWRDPQRHLAIQGRGTDIGPEGGLGERHGDGHFQVGPVPLEDRMATGVHPHEQVARLATRRTGPSLAAHPDTGTVVDTGRDLDGNAASVGLHLLGDAGDGLVERQGDFGFAVPAGLRDRAVATASETEQVSESAEHAAAEEIAQVAQVVDADVLRPPPP